MNFNESFNTGKLIVNVVLVFFLLRTSANLTKMELTFVFLLLCGRSEALPRERASDEIHEDVPEGLHVIPPTLFNTQMSVNAGIPSGARQGFPRCIAGSSPRHLSVAANIVSFVRCLHRFAHARLFVSAWEN